MCGPTTLMVGSVVEGDDDKKGRVVVTDQSGLLKIITAMGVVFVIVIIALLASVVALAFNMADDEESSSPAMVATTPSDPIMINITSAGAESPPTTIVINSDGSAAVVETQTVYATTKGPDGVNPCDGKNPDVPNADCVVDAIVNVGPQSGSNVTAGYKGSLEVDFVPVTVPYYQAGLCPVNVHWHLGAEHLSVGEYDEAGMGPTTEARRLAGDTRLGFQCHYYNSEDPKFTTEFDWQHCVDMKVGETYEVHWPHSAAGACGTMNQYQTPFYDGVFCRDGVLYDSAAQVGVQAQVFTIVNDEEYYYPDLMRGMIVDGQMGADIAKYTGSTTGTSRDNEICSQYSPITWQVDRKCHMVSASTFDKMCADMKAQRDDMSDDLYPHGSRELVADHLAADNHQDRFLRKH